MLISVLVFQGRGALQDIDQMSLFKPLCKFCASVSTVREIIPTVRKALQIATSGTPGKQPYTVSILCLSFHSQRDHSHCKKSITDSHLWYPR